MLYNIPHRYCSKRLVAELPDMIPTDANTATALAYTMIQCKADIKKSCILYLYTYTCVYDQTANALNTVLPKVNRNQSLAAASIEECYGMQQTRNLYSIVNELLVGAVRFAQH